jgi:hypothetical protein
MQACSLLKALQGTIDFLQQLLCDLIHARVFCGLHKIDRGGLVMEEARVVVHQSLEQPFCRHVSGHCQAQGVGDEGQSRPLTLVLGDEPQENTLLEGAPQKQIADDRVMLLAVAVDAAIALFQAIGVEGELQVDQVMAALMQVEAFGRRIGADQHQAILATEAISDLNSDAVRVIAAHGQDRTHIGILKGLDQGLLAIGIFGVDDDIRPRITPADVGNFHGQLLEFRVLSLRRISKCHQLIECMDDSGHPGEGARARLHRSLQPRPSAPQQHQEGFRGDDRDALIGVQ